MWKNKYIMAAGIGLMVVLIGGGFFWSRHGRHTAHVRSNNGPPSQNVIPLGGDQSGANGLTVSSGGASDLGQLGGNQKTQGATTGGNTNASAINPAQFTEYEKYKDSPNALFGDVQTGSGAELTAGKKAAVYYKGWLTNGQLFDQTRTDANGTQQPFLFTLGAHEVIPGWEQGVYGMKAGGTRIIIVPPAVGYGAKAQGPIPPNSVLVFQVQLLQVQ